MLRMLLLSMVAMLLAALAGCQYHTRPQVEIEPYTGPEIVVDTWGTEHRVILVAPTGGWSFEIDQVRRSNARHEVFVTATRPDPDLMVTQAIEHHERVTGVDSREPVDVYARLVEFGADAAAVPYRLAARAQ